MSGGAEQHVTFQADVFFLAGTFLAHERLHALGEMLNVHTADIVSAHWFQIFISHASHQLFSLNLENIFW